METIKCRKCGKELPLDMFYKNKARKNGYQTICKECWNEYINTRKSKKESMGPVFCNNRERGGDTWKSRPRTVHSETAH